MTPPPENFVFNGAENSSFETAGNFVGGIAPGNSLDVGESVIIASNTASIASGSLIDDGSITVNSGAGFIDTGAVAGTGTLSILPGASTSLTGGGSLGSIIDAGSLTVAGTFAGPISLASGAQLTLFDFTDNSSIAGAGTLAVTSGGYIQLGGNISLGC